MPWVGPSWVMRRGLNWLSLALTCSFNGVIPFAVRHPRTAFASARDNRGVACVPGPGRTLLRGWPLIAAAGPAIAVRPRARKVMESARRIERPVVSIKDIG